MLCTMIIKNLIPLGHIFSELAGTQQILKSFFSVKGTVML